MSVGNFRSCISHLLNKGCRVIFSSQKYCIHVFLLQTCSFLRSNVLLTTLSQLADISLRSRSDPSTPSSSCTLSRQILTYDDVLSPSVLVERSHSSCAVNPHWGRKPVCCGRCSKLNTCFLKIQTSSSSERWISRLKIPPPPKPQGPFSRASNDPQQMVVVQLSSE